MDNDSKKTVKEDIATAASTAVGATAGVVAGSVLSAEANAQETPMPDPAPNPEPIPTPDPQPTPHPDPKPEPKPEPRPEHHNQGKPESPQPPVDPEVEVVAYDRVTNEDGSQMDIAVLSVNGNEMGVYDVDLDGRADFVACDVNHNGVIEQHEVEYVGDQEFPMQSLADAAGFNPQYAQNDMPDYVNDADVDTYMA